MKMKESVLQINCHHSSVLTRVHGRRKNKVAEPDSGPRLEDLLQWYTCRRSQWHVKKKKKKKQERIRLGGLSGKRCQETKGVKEL